MPTSQPEKRGKQIVTPDELRAWMQASGYSVRGLASELGVGPNTVQRWRNGERAIPPFLHLALQQLPVMKTEKAPWGAGYVKPMYLASAPTNALLELEERWGVSRQEAIVRALIAAAAK